MEIKTRELCENGKIEKIANAVFDKNINGSEYEQKKTENRRNPKYASLFSL